MISAYIKYLLEDQKEIWTVKKKQWIVVDLKDVDEDIRTHLWEMYQKTYGTQTGEHGLSLDNYKSMNELLDKYKLCWLIDVDQDPDPDAFIIYKDMPAGNKKISLLGSDRSEAGKRVLLDKLYELLKTHGWYIEASAKLEDICRTKGFNFVDDPEKVKQLISGHKSKTMQWIGNGYYTRDLTNSNVKIKKRIYGLPN